MIQGHHVVSLLVPVPAAVVVGCVSGAPLVAGALVGTTLIDGRVVWAAVVTASLVGEASVVATWAGTRWTVRVAGEAPSGRSSYPQSYAFGTRPDRQQPVRPRCVK